jgi:Family of unknown function (DUF5947)
MSRGTGALAASGDRCELCPRSLIGGHEHAVDCERLTMVCLCADCAARLGNQPAGARYRRPTERVLADPEFQISEATWSAWQIPERLAYFSPRTSGSEWIAVYPGPSGTIRRELPPEQCAPFATSRLAQTLVPGAEVMLVAGPSGSGPLDVLAVPLDRVYAPVAILREAWGGSLGRREAWQQIGAIFSELQTFAAFLSSGGKSGDFSRPVIPVMRTGGPAAYGQVSTATDMPRSP